MSSFTWLISQLPFFKLLFIFQGFSYWKLWVLSLLLWNKKTKQKITQIVWQIKKPLVCVAEVNIQGDKLTGLTVYMMSWLSLSCLCSISAERKGKAEATSTTVTRANKKQRLPCHTYSRMALSSRPWAGPGALFDDIMWPHGCFQAQGNVQSVWERRTASWRRNGGQIMGAVRNGRTIKDETLQTSLRRAEELSSKAIML